LNCCGFDAIPWDLMTFKGHEIMQKANQNLKKIEFYDFLQGELSSGTFKTLIHSLSTTPPKTALGFDPLQKALGEHRKTNKTLTKRILRWPKYDFAFQSWVGIWGNADVNYAVVKRS